MKTLSFFILSSFFSTVYAAQPVAECFRKLESNKTENVWTISTPLTSLSGRKKPNYWEIYTANKNNGHFQIDRSICKITKNQVAVKKMNSQQSSSPWIQTNNNAFYSLHNYLASDINALLGDTVNEGEIEAYVLRDKFGRPAIACSIRKSKGSNFLFCNLSFRWSMPGWDDVEPGIVRCRLRYVQNSGQYFQAMEDDINYCLESLYEGPY